jgi:hypothetical protein
MTTRAKFRVTSITEHAGWNGKTVKLTPQYDTTIEEDRRYAKATPSGEISLTIDNPPAFALFKNGQYMYVDFTPIES